MLFRVSDEVTHRHWLTGIQPRGHSLVGRDAMDSSVQYKMVMAITERYELDAQIGEGTFGKVRKARERRQDGTLGNTVAIKSFKSNQGVSFTTCREISVRLSSTFASLPPGPFVLTISSSSKSFGMRILLCSMKYLSNPSISSSTSSLNTLNTIFVYDLCSFLSCLLCP